MLAFFWNVVDLARFKGAGRAVLKRVRSFPHTSFNEVTCIDGNSFLLQYYFCFLFGVTEKIRQVISLQNLVLKRHCLLWMTG